MSEMRARSRDESERHEKERLNRPKRGSVPVDMEEGLLGLLKRGDPRAPTILVKRYHNRLFSIAGRICSDPADAEEVLQDVYMTALKSIDRFQGKSALGTWLYRITVNTALMKLRSQRRMKSNTVSMTEVTATNLESEGRLFPSDSLRTPEETMMSVEFCEQILETVDGLPESYRSVLRLRAVKGLSTKETSKALNVSAAAVKSRLHRGRSLIKKRVEPFLA